MACDFVRSDEVRKGVIVVNGLDTAKFPLLLTRIMKSVYLEEKPFNETQEAKLETSLNLDANNVALLLHTLQNIIKQAAFQLASPGPILSQQLLNLGMDNEKVKVFLRVWADNAEEVVKKFSQQKVTPAKLEDINWRIHLKMAQATKAKMGRPIAIIGFGISNNDASKTNDNILLEFNHEELYAFSNQLDDIQTQLDALQ